MEQGALSTLQQMALSAYDRVPQSEAAAWMQAAMLAEIALQLQKHNEQLAKVEEELHALREIQGMAHFG